MTEMIAVQYSNEKARDNVVKLLKSLSQYGLGDNVILFKAFGMPVWEDIEVEGVEYSCIQIPEDKDTSPKQKNFILDYAKQNGLDSFLHIIEDNVVVDKDPREYIEKVQHTMDVLDYSIYFSTVTDPCNYVFKKFCPRLTLRIDEENVQQKLSLPSKISFTSHSNTAWTIYDFSKMADAQKYDEKFSVAMYFIIEYLARRRATKSPSQLYFMNQYLSIVDEIGVYHIEEIPSSIRTTPQTMQEEDGIFRSMNVDYAPDNNIDQVLDMFYAKLKEKMA